mmetsp:Transcript_26285/g.91431  ORF Transcript_26285/g.91431 Transcript_26285/m.91431 type:complete len:333 (-) Transcript_26285:651-1649(-)
MPPGQLPGLGPAPGGGRPTSGEPASPLLPPRLIVPLSPNASPGLLSVPGLRLAADPSDPNGPVRDGGLSLPSGLPMGGRSALCSHDDGERVASTPAALPSAPRGAAPISSPPPHRELYPASAPAPTRPGAGPTRCPASPPPSWLARNEGMPTAPNVPLPPAPPPRPPRPPRPGAVNAGAERADPPIGDRAPAGAGPPVTCGAPMARGSLEPPIGPADRGARVRRSPTEVAESGVSATSPSSVSGTADAAAGGDTCGTAFGAFALGVVADVVAAALVAAAGGARAARSGSNRPDSGDFGFTGDCFGRRVAGARAAAGVAPAVRAAPAADEPAC